MVLATRLKLLGGAAFFLLSTGCQAEPNNVSDEAVLDSHNFQLISNESNCLLVVSKDQNTSKFELSLQPPCYFAKKNDASLLTFSYPDKNLHAVALVIGNPISTEKRKKWNLDAALICGEKRQAVYLSKGDTSVSSTTLDGGLACKDTGIEEKDFFYFANEFEKNK